MNTNLISVQQVKYRIPSMPRSQAFQASSDTEGVLSILTVLKEGSFTRFAFQLVVF